MNEKIEEKIRIARTQMQKSNPFFSYLAMQLSLVEVDEKAGINTMGVDNNGNLYYFPPFVATLSLDELKAVLAHEVMHVAFEHTMEKCESGRDHMLVNVAQDIVINDILVQDGFRLPAGCLLPRDHVFHGADFEIKDVNKKCWELVYDELLKKIKKQKMASPDKVIRNGSKDQTGKQKTKGGNGPQGVDPTQNKNKNQTPIDWKKQMNEAMAHAKLQGKAPAGMDRTLDELNNPQLHWKELLQRFIVSEIPFDFTYSRPSKKSQSIGVYLPATYRENIEIAIGLDTSGSMSDKDIKDCVSEVLGILRAFDSVKLTVLECDADVHAAENIESVEELQALKIKGGGGTDFVPVFEWLKKNKPEVKAVVFFTDGYGNFPQQSPDYPVLWCVTENGMDRDKFPFGMVTKMKPEEVEELSEG